ncbi:MAG: heme-copper oxidase subunit III [Chthoniobacterales bacterium]|nr:heme-copper oxidase subunit III [Chthoniobacterales bacterium]
MSTAALTSHDATSAHASQRTAVFGMTIFLASEAMLFAGLIAGYLVLRLSSPAWPPSPDLPHLPIFLTGINTVFLISSSLTYHAAEVAVKKGRGGLIWLLITVLLGSLFLGIQAYEWTHLYHEGLWFNKGGAYGSTFFVLTGFHGLHVFLGVMMILFAFLRQLGGAYTAESHTYLVLAGMYWHFVDVVWLFLYTVLYLI